jgi:hypothetical protein
MADSAAPLRDALGVEAVGVEDAGALAEEDTELLEPDSPSGLWPHAATAATADNANATKGRDALSRSVTKATSSTLLRCRSPWRWVEPTMRLAFAGRMVGF